MNFVRWFLGRIILSVDFLTRPKPIVRVKKEQEAMDALTANMYLYQFNACPFCVKVRRQIRKHALNIEVRDAKNNAVFKEELIRKGGKHKVPCLRIGHDAQDEHTNEHTNEQWLYESKAIQSFLQIKLGLS